MRKTTIRNTIRLGTQATELMFAAPQVIAHRLARMTATGAGKSRRDQDEFHRMSTEKFAAFGQSWNGMAFQMLKANTQMTRAFMLGPWLSPRSFSRAAAQMQSSALRIMTSGMAPVHQRAVANAKRLRRAKAR